MNLDLLVDGVVRVTVTNYLKNIVSDFPKTIQGIVTTPEADKLFKVRE